MQCKMFFSFYPNDLSTELQQWLDTQNGAITIHNIAASGNDSGYCVSLFYEETAGPQYRLAMVAARRHEAVEEGMNQLLATNSFQTPPMVAMASTRGGHGIFLLRADESD